MQLSEKRTKTRKEPRPGIGSTRRRNAKPVDRITAKVLAAEAAGYGCHYGNFVADHPDAFKDWEPGQPVPVPDPMPVRVCPVCGQKFASANKNKVYCGDRCKERGDGAKRRAKKAKQEEMKK